MAPGVLSAADDRGRPCLIDALGSDSNFEALEARDVLVELGDAVADDLAALEHREGHVACVAGHALAWIGDRRAAEPLVRLLNAFDLSAPGPSTSYWDWELLADAVATLKVQEVVDPLIAALAVDDIDARQDAAAALGQIGEPRAVSPLIALLEDETIPVTFWVADALTEIGTPEAKEAVAA